MSSAAPNDTTQPTLAGKHEKVAEKDVEEQRPETSKEDQAEPKLPSEEIPVQEIEGGPSEPSKLKDKDREEETPNEETTADDENPPLPDEPVPTQNEWQAIWSPAHNGYYFYNSRTGETTWVNPLDPSASSGVAPTPTPDAPTTSDPTTATASTSTTTTKPNPTEPTDPEPPRDLSYLNGIDPDLAYLDPSLAVPPAGAKGPVPTFTARFGARSGAFTAMDGRRPEHLSESARAQRMSSVYFDTAAWEKEIAERDAQAKADEEAGVGDKRKRVTKQDIERFKAQKQAKKTLRNAWLRE